MPAQQLGILLYHPFFKLHTALLLQSLYSAVPTTSNSTQLYRPITPSSLQAQLMLLLQSLFFQRGTYLQVRLSSPATVPLQGGTHRYNCFHPSLLYSAIPLISSVHHLHYTFSSKSSLRCTRNRPLLPVHVYGTSRAPSSTLQSSPHRLQPTFHQNQAIHTIEASIYFNIQA